MVIDTFCLCSKLELRRLIIERLKALLSSIKVIVSRVVLIIALISHILRRSAEIIRSLTIRSEPWTPLEGRIHVIARRPVLLLLLIITIV